MSVRARNGRQTLRAGEDGDAVDRLRRAAPARDVEAHDPELPRRVPPEHAEAHDPDPDLAGRRLMAVVEPEPLALLGVVAALLAQVSEAVQDDVLAHAVRQVGIDHAHDRHVGQRRVVHEVVDAGAEREDRREGSGKPARLPGGCFQEAA